MIETTFTGALAKIAANSDSNLALAKIEATLALLQKAAADKNTSAEEFLKSLTLKNNLNTVVEGFWLKAGESIQLAKDGNNKPEVKELSVVPTKAIDECGIWGPATECKKIPDGARLAEPKAADHPSWSGQQPPQQPEQQYQPPPQNLPPAKQPAPTLEY